MCEPEWVDNVRSEVFALSPLGIDFSSAREIRGVPGYSGELGERGYEIRFSMVKTPGNPCDCTDLHFSAQDGG